MFSMFDAINLLNEEFQKNNLDFQFHHYNNDDQIESPVFDNQIKTFANVLNIIINDPTKSVAINGLLQSGKSKILTLNNLIAPIMQLAGHNYLVMTFSTNRNTHLQQYMKDHILFCKTFGNVLITNFDNNNETTFNEYMSLTHRAFKNKVHYDFVFSRTNNARTKVKIDEIYQNANINNYNVIVQVDEVHFAMNMNSNFDHFVSEFKNTFYDYNSRNIMIGISATPFMFTSLENFNVVSMKLGQNYQGINAFGGEVFDKDAITTLQEMHAFDEVSMVLSNTFPYAFHDNTIFTAMHSSIDFADNIDEYRQKVVHEVSQFIRNTFQGSIGRTGMVIRWANNNQDTSDFIDMLDLPGYNIIPYFEEYGGMDVKDTIDRYAGNGKYVFFVTGSARMADAFPNDAKYFIDFTNQSSTLASLLQGIYGRSCGYGKQSVVYMSRNNFNAIMDYYNTNGEYVIHPHESVVVEKKKRGRKPMSYFISRDMNDMTINRMLDDIQSNIVDKWLDHSISDLKKSSKKKAKENNSSKNRKVNLFDIVTDEALSHIKNYIENSSRFVVDFLHANGTDNNENSYNIDEFGRVEIGFRASEGGNRKAVNSLYPQIFVEYNGKWIISGIQLRLKNPLYERHGSFALPSAFIDKEKIAGGIAYDFMSKIEKQKALTMKQYQKVFIKGSENG